MYYIHVYIYISNNCKRIAKHKFIPIMFFNELNSNPSNLFKYLNKFVNIEFNPIYFTSKQKFIRGWIYTIDPVSLRFSFVILLHF